MFFHCCMSVHLVGIPLLHDQQPAEKNVPHVCQLILIALYLCDSLKNIYWNIRLHGWHLFFKGQVKIEHLLCLINNCSLKMTLGGGGIAPHSHEFSCGWRRMVSFIPWLTALCLWKLPLYIGLEAESVHAPAGASKL
jgi:hypothetical protein